MHSLVLQANCRQHGNGNELALRIRRLKPAKLGHMLQQDLRLRLHFT